MDRRVAEVAHRVVVAVVVLHRLGVVAEQVGRLLDLAERLDPVLADLDGHDRGVVHEPVADELGRPGVMISTRSRHGIAAQAGWAARAAATASSTSAAVPFANVPRTMSRSIGERTSNVPSPSRQEPPM